MVKRNNKTVDLYPFVELNATDFTTIIGIAPAHSFCAILTVVFMGQYCVHKILLGIFWYNISGIHVLPNANIAHVMSF